MECRKQTVVTYSIWKIGYSTFSFKQLLTFDQVYQRNGTFPILWKVIFTCYVMSVRITQLDLGTVKAKLKMPNKKQFY